jgi:ankyrin repeat protein
MLLPHQPLAPKVNGRTALHFAAGWGQAIVTEQLLRKGCNVDVIDKAGMSR